MLVLRFTAVGLQDTQMRRSGKKKVAIFDTYTAVIQGSGRVARRGFRRKPARTTSSRTSIACSLTEKCSDRFNFRLVDSLDVRYELDQNISIHPQ